MSVSGPEARVRNRSQSSELSHQESEKAGEGLGPRLGQGRAGTRQEKELAQLRANALSSQGPAAWLKSRSVNSLSHLGGWAMRRLNWGLALLIRLAGDYARREAG